ncbi:hypothetical protein Taro_036876 [Colocasia esculenta]|uniref:Uncharacterized protein n=1 Tax=Colocasia esculenta TaxID=4460 RepID=A0A843WMZ2_COLES|nr:hypothetical protein [Colocasia esculenta]
MQKKGAGSFPLRGMLSGSRPLFSFHGARVLCSDRSDRATSSDQASFPPMAASTVVHSRPASAGDSDRSGATNEASCIKGSGSVRVETALFHAAARMG